MQNTSTDNLSSQSELNSEPNAQLRNQTNAEQEKIRYEAIIASIGQGLVITDKSGKIITYNKTAETMLGWSEQEALGKSIGEIINVDYKSVTQTGSNFGGQSTLYFVRKNKTTFPAAITSTSYIQGTAILGTITLFRDITNELNIEAIKNDFISLASHQLRTPLSAIKWYTDMLIKGDAGKLTDKQSNFMQRIFDSTERMIDLVNTLLKISRIESGRISVNANPTDITLLLEQVLQEIKISYGKKNQEFSVHIEESLPKVVVDSSLLREVYTNLLTNAAKYTPEKGKITITIFQQDSNLLSQIQDNGYGIVEKEKNRVFGKFFRGSNIVQQVSEGTGLGLYLIKALVELCQGKIWYESKEGIGTTFSFSIPVVGMSKKGVVELNT